MKLPYTIYNNANQARFLRFGEEPIKPQDFLIKGYEGVIEELDDTEANMDDYLAAIFSTHNADDRPDGATAPSLSIGDVVVIGETAFVVKDVGWGFYDLASHPSRNIITDVTYIEYKNRRS